MLPNCDVFLFSTCIHTCTHTLINLHERICIYMRTCMHTYTHSFRVCKHKYMHAHMHIFKHTGGSVLDEPYYATPHTNLLQVPALLSYMYMCDPVYIVCCSVLQSVAMLENKPCVIGHFAIHCTTLHHFAKQYNTLQNITTPCNSIQHAAMQYIYIYINIFIHVHIYTYICVYMRICYAHPGQHTLYLYIYTRICIFNICIS